MCPTSIKNFPQRQLKLPPIIVQNARPLATIYCLRKDIVNPIVTLSMIYVNKTMTRSSCFLKCTYMKGHEFLVICKWRGKSAAPIEANWTMNS